MLIEVATDIGAPAKDKGDLLEKLTADLLKIQNYEVATELRVTGSELDLLCQHKVNRRQIYVECKAHRAPLSAEVLTKLLGTIEFKHYQEGWLISAGALGKDAKGFQLEWEQKTPEDSQRISIYTPDRVIEALQNARLIQPPPHSTASSMVPDEDLLGEWMLLITPYGRHWVVSTLIGGVPNGVLAFSAQTGNHVGDSQTLVRLAKTDTSLNNLDFEIFRRLTSKSDSDNLRAVVEVQYGENWSDYRPARPEDFVGRKDEQNQVIKFFDSVVTQKTLTRVFAITGDSGMGKSSLIAKLRARTQNNLHHNKFFIFAVDVRAATDSSYIHSALLKGMVEAAQLGFGEVEPNSLRLSNPTNPLSSESIQRFLHSLEERRQIVCVIFDQFEELFSKSELFSVFEVAQNLFWGATSIKSNLVLGFAWKTDSTVQQEHPAYFMWHSLADHRLELRLRRFTHSEASSATTVFEKEIKTELRSDLRRQLIENSQGYPWLLKKLAIHIYEQIIDGISQSEIMNNALDIESLFKRDLQQLSHAEDTCLKMIAGTAPADWYEILEASDQDTLRSLQVRRLIVRSGDRVNLYWDIFREYVLTKTVPSIPMTYLPSSTSLRTMLAVAQLLDHVTGRSPGDLGRDVGVSEKSVGNIIRDLTMFGIASGSQSQIRLSDDMESSDPKIVLRRLRQVLRTHALTRSLSRYSNGTILTTGQLIEALRQVNPAAQHQQKTWKIYADRMAQWLSAVGFLEPSGEHGWKWEDRGEDSISPTNALIRRYYTRHPQSYRENTLFIGDTSPSATVTALDWLISQPPKRWREIETAGHRNGARTLLNLRLIRNEHGRYHVTSLGGTDISSLNAAVWNAANKEPVMALVCRFLEMNPTASAQQVGEIVAREYERDWTPASLQRIGHSLRQWGMWLIAGKTDSDEVPVPPGRNKTASSEAIGQLVFDLAL